MNSRKELIEVFQDTAEWCRQDKTLAAAVRKAREQSVIYPDGTELRLPEKKPAGKTLIEVTARRSFEAAMALQQDYPKAKAAVHNFASATNPGGGVTRGSRAQEECLCRCSTLYPVLRSQTFWDKFYGYHRSLHDTRYTDTCIYSPGILIIKTDTDVPERMDQREWHRVDVLTCAAPNLRERRYDDAKPGRGSSIRVSDEELLTLHKKRGRHMLSAAAVNGAECLVLGAFGCGAFQNKPEIVAEAYRQILKDFDGYFRKIEFAVYCTPRDSRNYNVFREVLGTE